VQTIVGVDFGVPRRAGEQAKKIILIEAKKRSDESYEILPKGRNARLVAGIADCSINRSRNRSVDRGTHWRDRRSGWTMEELRDSLVGDDLVAVAAFDFPFSLPTEILEDVVFANAVGRAEAFGTRAAWQDFVASKMPLTFNGTQANSVMVGWPFFDPWRNPKFWIGRSTDKATRASPPLKDKFQSVFNMTIAGASLLSAMSDDGYQLKIDDLRPGRAVLETYPRQVAANLGFVGSYKQQPLACFDFVIQSLGQRGIDLRFDPAVEHFCRQYQTGDADHDGVDAFLCLIAAIFFDQGRTERCGAPVDQEGAIVVPCRQ
jgi:hypothetical protein